MFAHNKLILRISLLVLSCTFLLGQAQCPQPTGLRAFVTQALVPGDFGGVSVADAICQSEAQEAGLTGIYKAWLSETGVSPSSSFSVTAESIKLVNKTLIANDSDDLMDGEISNPLNRTADGGFIYAVVWTGTDEYGDPTNNDCSGWQDQTSSTTASIGRTNQTNYKWTNDTVITYGCDKLGRFLCFEQ